MTEDEMMAKLIAALHPYGVTDITLMLHPEDGDQVTILTPDITDIDVAEMVANDILKPGPVWFDLGAMGAGKTFVFKDWPHVGGAVFMGRFSNRLKRARYNFDMARFAISAISNPIEADGLYDLAAVRYEQQCSLAMTEGEGLIMEFPA